MYVQGVVGTHCIKSQQRVNLQPTLMPLQQSLQPTPTPLPLQQQSMEPHQQQLQDAELQQQQQHSDGEILKIGRAASPIVTSESEGEDQQGRYSSDEDSSSSSDLEIEESEEDSGSEERKHADSYNNNRRKNELTFQSRQESFDFSLRPRLRNELLKLSNTDKGFNPNAILRQGQVISTKQELLLRLAELASLVYCTPCLTTVTSAGKSRGKSSRPRRIFQCNFTYVFLTLITYHRYQQRVPCHSYMQGEPRWLLSESRTKGRWLGDHPCSSTATPSVKKKGGEQCIRAPAVSAHLMEQA